MERSVAPGPDSALLAIDLQNDFIPGGALAVAGGNEVVPLINALAKSFVHVVLTQDWHPAGHSSFASAHPGAKLFDVTRMPYGDQVLWPDHCVQGGSGAALHADVAIDHAMLILRKGCNPSVDSYSAFFEADSTTPTGLSGYLAERGIRRVYVAGLATDYSVAFTALDARRVGLETFVVEDACRAIDLNGSLAKAWTRMTAAGVKRIDSAALAPSFRNEGGQHGQSL